MTDRGEIRTWVGAALRDLQLTTADEVTEETGLLGQGVGLDSMEMLQLVAAAEERFDLTIDDDDLEPVHFHTVGTFVTFLEEMLP